MKTERVAGQNLWHALACLEKSAGNATDGIRIQSLKKGDIITLETLRANDGFAARVILRITHPQQGGVQIVRAVRFLGGLAVEMKNSELDSGIRGHYIVRGDRRDGRDPELGWIGIGADVCLTGGAVFRSVKNISLNNVLIVFPPSSVTH